MLISLFFPLSLSLSRKTPSGRFETNTKVCLSFSAYHPELWQPAWGIRLILEALISFLPAPADGAIGALDWSKEERKKLAKKSVDFVCPICGNCANLLPKLGSITNTTKSTKFSKDLAKLHELQLANEGPHQKIAKPAHATCDTNESEMIDDVTHNGNNKTTAEIASKTSSEDITADTTTDTTNEDLKTPDCPTNDTHETLIKDEQETNTNCISTSTQEEKEEEEEIPAPTEVPPGQLTHPNPEDAQITWLSDPLLHGSIVTFAAIVFLLLRKVDSLLEELQLLEENDYH